MKRVDIGEGAVSYEVLGEGEPLVLIMGIGGQGIFWPLPFCERLMALGFQVIRFDHRDIGESAYYDHLGHAPLKRILLRRAFRLKTQPPYRLADMAGDVVGLLDHLDVERAHIVGLSMGGMIAQRVAIHHGARVRSLTSIMSTDGRIYIGKPRAMGALLAKPPRNREEAIAQGLRTFERIGSPGYPPDEALLSELMGRSFDRGRHPAGIARQLAAILAEPSRRDALGALTMPSLVIHGADDPLVPVAAGRATARAIPGAMYREFPGMGHDLPPGLWAPISEAIAEVAERARG